VRWLHGATIALLAVALYANSLPNEFINDDVNAIVENPAVHSGDLGSIFATASWWTPNAAARVYRPLVTLSFALNYALGGLQPLGYHVGNLLLHALASVMLYLLLIRLGGSPVAAWAAALLFAAHPLNTEAVTTVVGRAEVMAALAVLLALWVDAGGYAGDGLAPGRAAVVLVVFACGLLCKETVVTLVPAMLLTDLAVRCRWDRRALLAGLRAGRGWQYVALLLVLCGYLVLRSRMDVLAPADPAMNPLVDEPTSIRVLNALVIAGRYLWLLILPLHLSADYMVGSLPILQSAWDWRIAASALGLAAGAAAALLAVRRAPMVTWGLLFAACTYSLVSNVFFAISATMMGERWLYLPATGFCTAVAFGAAALLAPLAYPQVVGGLLTSLLLLAFATRTVARNRDWRDYIHLWTATLEVVPGSFKAREGLAWGYFQQGRFDEAATLLAEARRINDGDPRTYVLQAAAYQKLGKVDEAIQVYEDLLTRMPEAFDVRYQVANLYLQQQRFADAIREYEEAAKLSPDTAVIRLGLGKAYFFNHDLRAAEASFDEALRLQPNLTEALVGRGACAHNRRDFEAAARDFLSALDRGERPTDKVRLSLEAALSSYAQAGPESAAAARPLAARALAYFPDSPVLRQLAAAPG
jgi:protein O-mannosyl-transferase